MAGFEWWWHAVGRENGRAELWQMGRSREEARALIDLKSPRNFDDQDAADESERRRINMAPIKKRTTARAKSARAVRPSISAPKADESDALFPSSKRDKQKIKHSSFVSKIEKSSTKSQKRRRPNKKLVANLESLANALPGLDDAGVDGEVIVGQAKIQKKSLKSRPGAMKRKEKIEKMEKERFNQNLVQLASSSSGGLQDRWAALKNHVQGTMEVKPEFAKKQGAT